MVKLKMLAIRLTREQVQLLRVQSRAAGYGKVSEYVRVMLFRKNSVEQKLDEILEMVNRRGR
jgi:hypothetical protein